MAKVNFWFTVAGHMHEFIDHIIDKKWSSFFLNSTSVQKILLVIKSSRFCDVPFLVFKNCVNALPKFTALNQINISQQSRKCLSILIIKTLHINKCFSYNLKVKLVQTNLIFISLYLSHYFLKKTIRKGF